MLDNVVLHYYFGAPEQKKLLAASQNKAKAAGVAMEALKIFRIDLVSSESRIEIIRSRLDTEGFALSPIRILEVLLWTEVEPMSGYRKIGLASS
jgi:hypothetical protein